MPYFHVTAVFEVRGASSEEADRAIEALFQTIAHPRVRYYEHQTSGGLGPYGSSKSLYFTALADFDVEAHTEEKAGSLAEEILDALSTDDIQYIGHGIIAGAQRVQPKPQVSREQEREARTEETEEREEREEGGGRGRRQRGRRRGRGTERDGEDIHETPKAEAVAEHERPPTHEAAIAPGEAPEERAPSPDIGKREHEVPTPAVLVEEMPPVPPPRSSASMHVTLTVNLRSSELVTEEGAPAPADKEELIALAVAEARRRHAELPANGVPESEVSILPGGDRVVLLTWHYDAPVPSATEAA